MKKLFVFGSAFTLCLLAMTNCFGNSANSKNHTLGNIAPTDATHPTDQIRPNDNIARIQVAILLDTSGSMDGLIEQVKARLWNIVNTLTCLRFNGKVPELEIALYEYGNSANSPTDWVRMVTPFTSDLDLLSEKLFALTTYGGDEYCGAVINKAVRQLDWSRGINDIRMIYIAGNEPFTQGRIHYSDAIRTAVDMGITVNTIHCGSESGGINGSWRDGAIRGKGKYFFIDHNTRVRHIDTPFDSQISAYNSRLNSTYINYGAVGEMKKESQMTQDENAKTVSSANFAERAVSKSKTTYKNSSWDLVDLYVENEAALEKVKVSELPKEYQNKSQKEIKEAVSKMATEREKIRKEIANLAQQRQAYIDAEMKKERTGDDLGYAINQSVIELANSKGYKMTK